MKNNDAAVAAIRFALDNRHEDPMTFLELWFEGEFGRIKKEWENVPEEVFIGADPVAAPTPPAQEDDPVYQLQDSVLGFWDDISFDEMQQYAKKGETTRTLYPRPKS